MSFGRLLIILTVLICASCKSKNEIDMNSGQKALNKNNTYDKAPVFHNSDAISSRYQADQVTNIADTDKTKVSFSYNQSTKTLRSVYPSMEKIDTFLETNQQTISLVGHVKKIKKQKYISPSINQTYTTKLRNWPLLIWRFLVR